MAYEPLIPRRTTHEVEDDLIRPSSRRDLLASSSINRDHGHNHGRPWRQSTAHLLPTDSIMPILASTPRPSYINLLANLNRTRKILAPRRSHSAPALLSDFKISLQKDPLNRRPEPKSKRLIVWQASIGMALYVIVGIAIFCTVGSLTGESTYKVIDALYFIVVSLCTIGYGDIVPDSDFSKLFTCLFILVGFGFIDILLDGLVSYICYRQEQVLLSTVDANRFDTMLKTYIVDKEKGRMRIRTKVVLALAVVILCITIGTFGAHFLEGLSWVDSVYLSVISVTTVGYGDYSFSTVKGRCFAVVWLLVSTLAVARAFLCLAELRIDKRNRMVAKWVLQKKINLEDLVAADLDNDGSISKSEFLIYKLKEMGKIAEKDILQIGKQFDLLDSTNNGKITLADLMDSG